MNQSIDKARPVAEKALADADVTRTTIGILVRVFYTRLRRNERLGPIFAREIPGDWEPHLEKMTDFWCSVILKSGDYQGRPVPVHIKLKDVTEQDFDIWLRIFGKTAGELFSQDTAAVFVERAERIARSLKIAMFFRLPDPAESFDRTP
ncbi:group III truncated hemoglobin [Mesorhizobium sp. M1312]